MTYPTREDRVVVEERRGGFGAVVAALVAVIVILFAIWFFAIADENDDVLPDEVDVTVEVDEQS